MSGQDSPVFGAEDVIQIASAFEHDDESFPIGGQATNLWAWNYGDTLLSCRPSTTYEIMQPDLIFDFSNKIVDLGLFEDLRTIGSALQNGDGGVIGT
jgi:hypothetical protein